MDGRVRAAGREGEGEREKGETRAGASPRQPHREGTSGESRGRRRRVQMFALVSYREWRWKVRGSRLLEV